jgi:hypothetical protein
MAAYNDGPAADAESAMSSAPAMPIFSTSVSFYEGLADCSQWIVDIIIKRIDSDGRFDAVREFAVCSTRA